MKVDEVYVIKSAVISESWAGSLIKPIYIEEGMIFAEVIHPSDIGGHWFKHRIPLGAIEAEELSSSYQEAIEWYMGDTVENVFLKKGK